MQQLEADALQNDRFENLAQDRLPYVDHTCRNLHAYEEALRPLSSEIEKTIARLSAISRPSALFSSLDNTVPVHQHERRSPPRARRRSWRTKAKYQRRRCPERLRPWQIDSLFEADILARLIGLPLNAFLTVSWKNTGQGTGCVQSRFRKATKAMGQWLRRRNCPATWLFVHENPGNSEPHFHMLIHIPCGQLESFKTVAAKWFDALESGVDIRPRSNVRDRSLAYLTKGTDFITARLHGATARNQGTVDFKRCGWTENIGAIAQKRRKSILELLNYADLNQNNI